jgi:putative ABC transport system permease protein
MALGASPIEVVMMVLRQGAKVIGIGMLLGLGIGGVLGQQMQLFLFGVKPWDPAVFATVALVLGAAAFAAVTVPAWRAASIDPAVALRDH